MRDRVLWVCGGIAACGIGAMVYLWTCQPTRPGEERGVAQPMGITAFLLDDGDVKWLEGNADLGALSAGTVNYRTITIVSKLDHPIDNIRCITGCGCTKVSDMKRSLAPGEECVMTLAYDTAGRAGNQDIRVMLASSDKAFTLALVGHVTHDIAYEGARAVPESIVCQYLWNGPRSRDYIVAIAGISGQDDLSGLTCEVSSAIVRAELLPRGPNGELRVGIRLVDLPVGPIKEEVVVRVRTGVEDHVVAVPIRGDIQSPYSVVPRIVNFGSIKNADDGIVVLTITGQGKRVPLGLLSASGDWAISDIANDTATSVKVTLRPKEDANGYCAGVLAIGEPNGMLHASVPVYATIGQLRSRDAR